MGARTVTPAGRTDKAKQNRLAAVRARGAPSLKVEGARLVGLRTFTPAELQRNVVFIDESYQRFEVRLLVNQLIGVLQAGGDVPEPIAVATRANDTFAVIDGQQRYWAHWNCGAPLKALVYDCGGSIDVERAMFAVMNNTVKPHANVRAKSWPGPSGRTLYFLDHGEESPIRGEVGWGSGPSYRYPASMLAQCIYVALTSTEYRGGRIEDTMRMLDTAIENDSGKVHRYSVGVTLLLKAVFGEGESPKSLYCAALASAAGFRWQGKRACALPEGRVIGSLKRMNWEAYLPKGHARSAAALRAEILRRWKDE